METARDIDEIVGHFVPNGVFKHRHHRHVPGIGNEIMYACNPGCRVTYCCNCSFARFSIFNRACRKGHFSSHIWLLSIGLFRVK